MKNIEFIEQLIANHEYRKAILKLQTELTPISQNPIRYDFTGIGNLENWKGLCPGGPQQWF